MTFRTQRLCLSGYDFEIALPYRLGMREVGFGDDDDVVGRVSIIVTPLE